MSSRQGKDERQTLVLPSRSSAHARASALLTFLCFILLAAPSLVLSASDTPDRPSQSSVGHPSKAIAYSRRGLANAHRLSSPGRAHRAAYATIGEEYDEARSLNNFHLSDIVVVSSVEGGIYGLRRDSGHVVWSLPPRVTGNAALNSTLKTAPTSAVEGFGPLVGTSYGPKQRSFAELAADVPLIDKPAFPEDDTPPDGSSGQDALNALQELGLYIVEPSNGQVYILTAAQGSASSAQPRTTLSKLPLTLPQLVELSPFSFPGDASRVFVGRKSTSLVELDVRTGKIGAVFGGAQGGGGVWCNAEDDVENLKPTGSEECAQGDDTTREWAYMGRTDYTLTIHMRGRPALSQTLRYSTFSPNAADREIADLWLRQAEAPDARTIMGMPEEGTILCFNSSMAATSPREHQDRTLWIREMGVTVAGIFDVVYPKGTSDQNPPQPLVLPHPKGTLRSLFADVPSPFSDRKGRIDPATESVLGGHQATYLGIADGQLYAMGSEQYPLVAFTPRAPAGHDGEGEAFYDHHSRAASTCASYGCLLGSYDVSASTHDGVNADELLGLGPGHAPLLGIGDGSDLGTHHGEQEVDGNDNATKKSQKAGEASKVTPERSWSSPSVIMQQIIILFLLAVLCGLIYVGGQELRRQYAEEAKSVTKDVVWEPIPAPPAASQPVPEASVNGNSLGPDETKADSGTAIGDLSGAQDDKNAQNGDSEKKKSARRRKRGKRAGTAVAHRGAKRDNSKENLEAESDDEGVEGRQEEIESGGKEEKSDAGPDVISNGTKKQDGVIDVDASAEEQVARIAARVSLTAEGGSEVELKNGAMAAARGNDRSLIISDEVLGYGSSGTVVFKGTFQNRAVAVKRLLRDFVDVAAKEVSLLESADNHANVIRYFYKEVTESFLFIALELCPASLSDIIEKPHEFQELSAQLKPKKALFQIASGLQHLHSLSIVHRDIKPQNILVSQTAGGQLKMLLSDFGLSKRLDGVAQTSFSQTVNNPGGTFGWRAPEILRGDVTLDAGVETGSSTTSSTNASRPDAYENGGGPDERKRLTRAVDIFAMGCLTYYVLSNGDHPFGSRFEREMNILKRRINLERLDGLGEEGYEAQHLIMAMISHEAKDRPSALHIMAHPYFWDAGRRLAFLQDASDRFDIMERDPPAAPLVALEENASQVIGHDWHKRLDRQVMEDLNKRRRYDPKSVAALLRAIRNKKHHIHDVPPSVRRLFTAAGGMRSSALGGNNGGGGNGTAGEMPVLNSTNSSSTGNLTNQVQLLPDGYLAYFTSRFPALFLHTYEVVNSFAMLKSESSFASYFKPISEEL